MLLDSCKFYRHNKCVGWAVNWLNKLRREWLGRHAKWTLVRSEIYYVKYLLWEQSNFPQSNICFLNENYLIYFYKSFYIKNDQLRCHAVSLIFCIIGSHMSSTKLNVFLLGVFEVFKLAYNDVLILVETWGKKASILIYIEVRKTAIKLAREGAVIRRVQPFK